MFSVTSESMTAVWVARERGLFKRHGLDMAVILMPRNPLAVAALIAGEIDAAIIGPGHLVTPVSAARTSSASPISHQARLSAQHEARHQDEEDLRAKRIAISGPGSTSHLVSLLALQGLNIDPVQGGSLFDDSGHGDEPPAGA